MYEMYACMYVCMYACTCMYVCIKQVGVKPVRSKECDAVGAKQLA